MIVSIYRLYEKDFEVAGLTFEEELVDDQNYTRHKSLL